MEFFNIKFWVVMQLLIDIVLVLVIVFSYKKYKSNLHVTLAQKATEQVFNMIEPILHDADETAKVFDKQLMAKKDLILDLNEKLDSRITSLNLLINRTESHILPKGKDPTTYRKNKYDQQKSVVTLYNKGFSKSAISQKLFIPKEEIDLVLDLKNKSIEIK